MNAKTLKWLEITHFVVTEYFLSCLTPTPSDVDQFCSLCIRSRKQNMKLLRFPRTLFLSLFLLPVKEFENYSTLMKWKQDVLAKNLAYYCPRLKWMKIEWNSKILTSFKPFLRHWKSNPKFDPQTSLC